MTVLVPGSGAIGVVDAEPLEPEIEQPGPDVDNLPPDIDLPGPVDPPPPPGPTPTPEPEPGPDGPDLPDLPALIENPEAVEAEGELGRMGRDDMAISLGDSFISGEGAEDFITGDGADDYQGQWPGWSTPETDPYFCHRSRNSLIFAAPLPDIEQRRNAACSGGRATDIYGPSHNRTGRIAQAEMLRTSASLHDVDLIVVGVGSNSVEMTFGTILALCHVAFMYDAADVSLKLLIAGAVFLGWFQPPDSDEFTFDDLVRVADQNGCERGDLPSRAQFDSVSDDVETALVEVIEVMRDEGYEDGSYRIIVQNYASPFTTVLPAALKTEDGGLLSGLKNDTDDSFNNLAKERYAHGCPVHEKSLITAGIVTTELYQLQLRAIGRVQAAYPDVDLLTLDVRNALRGGQLCEDLAGPEGKLANPVWFRDGDFDIQRTLDFDNIGFFMSYQDLVEPCGTVHFALCQESGHPNEDGHAVLGECIALAYEAGLSHGRCIGTVNGPLLKSNVMCITEGGVDVAWVNDATDDMACVQCDGKNAEVLHGVWGSPTSSGDVIAGTDGADVIDAKDGDDVVCALAGGDDVTAGPGDDVVYLSDGPDTADGGEGNDEIYGGKGKDQIAGGDGNDDLSGGGGRDQVAGDAGDDDVNGGKGQDKLLGGSGNDSLDGGKGKNDRCDGGPGLDIAMKCEKEKAVAVPI